MSLTRPPPSFASPQHLSSPSSIPRGTTMLPPSPAGSTRRLHIHVASTGRYLEVNVASNESIQAIKESLANWTHIPPQTQIFLTPDGIELDGRQSLNQYHAQLSPTDANGSLVYVFNKDDGQQKRNILPPTPPTFEVRFSEADVLVHHPSPERPNISASTVVVIGTLPKFEQSFKKHLLHTEAYLNGFGELMRYANNARAEQDAVLAALEAALNNLDRHWKHVKRTTDSFHSQYTATNADYHSLLDGFTRAVERLKEVEVTGKMRRYVGSIQASPNLEPNTLTSPSASPLALQPIASLPSPSAASPTSSSGTSSSSRITLYDILAPLLPKSHKSCEDCKQVQGNLDKKVEEMIQRYKKEESRVIEILTTARQELKSCSNIQELREEMTLTQSYVDEVQVRLAQVSEEYSELVVYVDKLEQSLSQRSTASTSGSSSTSASSSESQLLIDLPYPPLTAFLKFSPLAEKHPAEVEKFKTKWEEMRQKLSALIVASTVSVQSLFLDIHTKVSHGSYKVMGLSSIVGLNQSAFGQLSKAIQSSIQPVHSLPAAWSALLPELPRRRAFRRAFHQEASNIAQRLHKLAGDEVQRRERWHKDYGQFLPKGQTVLPSTLGSRPTWQGGFGPLIAQLNERPPLIDLSFSDFDANLPDLDTPPSLPRSASGHTLPVIDESSTTTSSATADTTTPINVPIIATSTAQQAIHSQFPWIAALTEAAEKNTLLEKEIQSLKLALSVAPTTASSSGGTPKSHSRKNSASSTVAAEQSTASPTLTSRSTTGASAEWKTKYDSKVIECNELLANAMAHEKQLQELKDELKKSQTNFEKIVTKANESNERIEKLESEKLELQSTFDTERKKLQGEYEKEHSAFCSFQILSATRAKEYQTATSRLKDIEKELDSLKSAHQFEKELIESTQQGSARKLAIANFAVPDLVLFVRNPTKPKDSFDQLEVFNISGEHFYISPESAQQWKQQLKRKQESDDEALAKQTGQSLSALPPAAPSASSSVSSSSSPPTRLVGQPNFGEFIGEVVAIDEYKAEPHQNPFGLPIGETYKLVTVIVPEEQK